MQIPKSVRKRKKGAGCRVLMEPAVALMLHGRMCRMSSQERCSSTGTQTRWVSSPKPCPRQLHCSCWTLLLFMIIYWASSASLGLDKRQRERIPSQKWKQSGSVWEPWNPPKLKGFSLQVVNSPHIRSNKLTQKKFQKSVKFWSLNQKLEVKDQKVNTLYLQSSGFYFCQNTWKYSQ